jgi:chromosome segregation ATPase
VLEDGWRGRAEMIVLLRSKVKRLESELEAATGRRDPKAAAMSSHHDVDKQAISELVEMEDERRRATEQLTTRYQELEATHAQTRGKLDAAKARSAVLENENAKFKKQLKVLIDKADTDDRLVDELRKELQTLRTELRATKSKLDASLQGSAYGHTRTAIAGTQLIHQQQALTQDRSHRLEQLLKSSAAT